MSLDNGRFIDIIEVAKIAAELMDEEQSKMFFEKLQKMDAFKRQAMSPVKEKGGENNE